MIHKSVVQKYAADILGEKLSFIKEDLDKFKKRTIEILGSGESTFSDAGKHLLMRLPQQKS